MGIHYSRSLLFLIATEKWVQEADVCADAVRSQGLHLEPPERLTAPPRPAAAIISSAGDITEVEPI